MMNHLLRQQCARLSATLALLQERVRDGIAGEIGDAVANACAEVVTSLLSAATRAQPDFDDDPWDEGVWEESTMPYTTNTRSPNIEALMLALWVGRHVWLWGQPWRWAALAVGLGAGYACTHGGPVTRTLVAMLSTIERLHTSTNALGTSATTLDQVAWPRS